MASNKREKLLKAAQAFCAAFADQKPPDEILSHFSASKDVRAFEHGLPQLAPFLGREFTGQEGLQEYFSIISAALKYQNMQFENFLVDSHSSQVSCRGHARFIASQTDQAWDETFAYILGFDDKYKVKSYEIWADTGAAYLALKGELGS